MQQLTVSISALEHYSYCPRQCGLIYVESVFDENVFTLEGSLAHDRSDDPSTTFENGIRVERALPLWSDQLGISGRGDVIEFHPGGEVVPVEFKHGPRRVSLHDDVQVCAQALFLEEMLGVVVTTGGVSSIGSKRRRPVLMNEALRERTRATIRDVRAMMLSAAPLPPAVNDARCPNCSLIDACVPACVVRARHRVAAEAMYTLPTTFEGDLL